jgi:S-DNA-T family DNA segregation ATPase FtsK/SpoIIIE
MTSNDDANGLDWQRYEAEVVDLGAERVQRDWADLDDQAAAHPVDSPEAQRPAPVTIAGLKASQRRPLVPAWLRSRAQLRDTARWATGYAAHTSAYHLTRSPKYAAKLAFRSPVGAGRVIRTFTRWVFDLEGEPVRQHTVRQEDPETYLKLSRHRDRRVRWRGMVAVFILGVLLAAGGVLALYPPMPRYAALAVLVTLLGIVGRPADRPLLDTAVMVPRVARLTSDVVSRALSVLGIAGITQALAKNPKAITFPAPITRDGPGWRADVELPYGVTATEVIERREKLAAGLARPLGCVWPEGNASVHPGRLVLWVGDEDMSKAKRPSWPLLKSGTVDLFKPQPFGTDQRGRWEHLTLMFIAMVIGSIPRMGKTFALRLALLIAALDPRAAVHAYDLKGTGDLSALAQVAHRYRAGDEEDDIEYAIAAMRELRDELRRQAKVIRSASGCLIKDDQNRRSTPGRPIRGRSGVHL